MRRRLLASLAITATCAAAGSAPALAGAPVRPKNGLYQGPTAQNLPINLRVTGRDAITELNFTTVFGTCDSSTFAGFGGGEPISNRGRFRIELPFGDKWQTTVRGRFVDRTRARGTILYTENEDRCGVASAKTRFRVKRSERL